jgi:hypothetical protein
VVKVTNNRKESICVLLLSLNNTGLESAGNTETGPSEEDMEENGGRRGYGSW